MTGYDLTAVIIVCVTVLVCTWLIAERWYAHRDRAYHRFTAACEARVTQAIDDLRRARDAARIALDEGTADRLEAIEVAARKADVKLLEHDRWIQARQLAGR